jgi:cephalosporin-C deacetylase-like acetyl esterase
MIDQKVKTISSHFGTDPALIAAVIQAEGNILKAVQCSMPSVETVEKAIEITCRSAVHAMSDYIKQTDPDGFVEFWASRWAPQGAKNDPTGLNGNWPTNVKKAWNVVHA